MTQPNLLELAKQGNSKAIACLLRPKLKSQGIAVKADIKKDCLIVFLESDEVPDEQASVEFIKKEVEKLGLTFIHVVKVYARQQGEYHPTWVKEFEIAAPAQIERPLPPGWTLRQANSKDKFKILTLVFISLDLRSLLVSLCLISIGAISLLLLLNSLYNGSVNWLLLMWRIPPFIIIVLGFIIPFICMDISNFLIVECNKELVGYGILNCFREDRKVRKSFWLNILSILGIFIVTLAVLFMLNGLAILFFLLIFIHEWNYLTIFFAMVCMGLLNYLIIKKAIRTILFLNPYRKLDSTEKKSSIQSLFVAPAWRRRGLGSALVRRLIQEAPLPLYVDSLPNEVSFYTRLGFVPLPRKSSPSTVVPLVYNIDSGVSSTKRRIN